MTRQACREINQRRFDLAQADGNGALGQRQHSRHFHIPAAERHPSRVRNGRPDRVIPGEQRLPARERLWIWGLS